MQETSRRDGVVLLCSMNPRNRALGLALFLLVCTSAAMAQNLVPVSFPNTQQTQVTDCSTPTVIDLGGGQKVTLEGGQFIRYDDGNFRGVMYASTSAAGCQRSDFGIRMYYLTPSQPIGSIRVTFSPPASNWSYDAYNFLGYAQWLATEGCGVEGIDHGCFSGAGLLPDRTTSSVLDSLSFGAPRPSPGFAIGVFENFFLPPPFPFPILYYPSQWAFGITALKAPQATPDIVRFDFPSTVGGDDGKILLSKAPWDFGYFSQYQVRGSAGPQVRVAGTLIDGRTKQPKSGSVYLRIDDPPDTAPYRGSDAAAGDNDGVAASLSGGTTTAGVTMVQADAQGRFEVVLSVASHTVGDNYQVEGAPNDKFQCGTAGCPKTGIFALWKRIYVEQENMFRSGSFLNDVTAAGSSQLFVEDPAPFQALTTGAQLELVHGERSNQPGYYSDLVTFNSVHQDQKGRWVVEIDPTTVPARDYGEMPSPVGGGGVQSPMTIMRDGVGVVQAGTYEGNDAYVAPLLAAAFVDVQTRTPIVTEVPLVMTLNRTQQRYFSERWFQAATGPVYMRVADPNVFHRTVAALSPLISIKGPNGGVGAELGATTVAGNTNYSLLFAQTIISLTAGAIPQFPTAYTPFNPVVLNGETVAHETVHFWVHAGGSDGTGHCTQSSYGGGFNCLMHLPYLGPELADGNVDMHYIAHSADSEYMLIRRAPDPVPQQ